ncbi:hypothetical protein SAMN05443144_1573 [Fodinibius roseus]|uniref:AhpC/TSA family protein n=1 Tax=Fodinibius roseus TaxID=1194090 RepID=A0A1M5MBY8_9BACT|nr:hypothetical protein [Fodinibius roseus]SHG74820.1 hypothetical protein SAMN05443144_1573 [Fodinibius roseus]
MFKKKVFFYSIIGLLILLNFYLMKSVRDRQVKINGMEWAAQKKIYFGNKDLKLKNKNLLKDINGITLLILFTRYGCSSCIRNEVDNINKYFKNLKKNTKIYYIGSEKSQQFEYYRRRFPIEAIEIDRNLFNGYVKVSNPVAILIDPKEALKNLLLFFDLFFVAEC